MENRKKLSSWPWLQIHTLLVAATVGPENQGLSESKYCSVVHEHSVPRPQISQQEANNLRRPVADTTLQHGKMAQTSVAQPSSPFPDTSQGITPSTPASSTVCSQPARPSSLQPTGLPAGPSLEPDAGPAWGPGEETKGHQGSACSAPTPARGLTSAGLSTTCLGKDRHMPFH